MQPGKEEWSNQLSQGTKQFGKRQWKLNRRLMVKLRKNEEKEGIVICWKETSRLGPKLKPLELYFRLNVQSNLKQG